MALNFLGIGAQKSGTTWLYETLSKHPQIAFPGGKEIHYWDDPRNRSVSWYQSIFSEPQLINGDITPAYGILSPKTIQTIHELWPNLRLVFIMRNPIERAWSAARMALNRAEMTDTEASDQWFIDHFKSQGSLARGDYETCIRQWRAVFNPCQLLILRFETIQSDPVQAANSIINHLGLDDFFTLSDAAHLSKKVFEGDGLAIRPSLLSVLHKIYNGKMASLNQYLLQTEQKNIPTC
jgi:hypothetical protein